MQDTEKHLKSSAFITDIVIGVMMKRKKIIIEEYLK